ncbi:MAG TPA: hypothetical protein VL307_19215 [Chitinophagaceae bacterium]|nr:hypothetical protein [Chitinophagaceae bacterium]
MKKIHFFAAIAAGMLTLAACGDSNNSGDGSKSPDSTANNVVPPPDNSSATNPSLGDTNFSKNQDTSSMRRDSANKQ